MYHLISWATFKPNATWFNVPDICKNATVDEPAVEWLGEGAMGENIKAQCAIAASQAARIVETSNGFDGASLLYTAFNKAGIETSTNLWSQQAAGSTCTGGPQVGDVFFDGVPATSVSIFLGDNKFAECPSFLGGRCSIVPQRDFTGGCRRYC
jgi:hypothetical protein